MAAGEERASDFYAVLGLKKDCSEADVRNAYKKLALQWHPDRCSASANSKFAKEKFQEIQEAYSVLSDSNKRFLYDVGVYENDDDENGMGDFLGEMAQMMSQTNPSDGHESFEELQQLFVDMFQTDLDAGFGGPAANGPDRATCSSSSSMPFWDSSISGCKRGSSMMNSAGKGKLDEFDIAPGTFCFGLNNSEDPLNGRGNNSSKRRNSRKPKVSSKRDVPSCNTGISY